MPHLLVVQTDDASLATVRNIAAAEGYDVHHARSLAEARRSLKHQPVDALVIDMHLPDGRGLELMEHADLCCGAGMILVTDRPSVDTAILALRRHALDYMIRPLNFDRLRGHLTQIAQSRRTPTRVVPIRDDGLGQLVGRSDAMRRLYESICRVAPTSAAVLIIGESGTGKEVVAQTIHALSHRAAAAIVAINCGAIPESLIESELFGHERGAFTGAAQRRHGVFERAAHGTLILDEIAEMPMELQVKLLRVLESSRFTRVGGEIEIDATARVIAATNRDPADAVPQGKLREDLLYRLSVFPLWVPPLRERGDDVLLLAEHFLAELNARQKTQRRFSDAMRDRMLSYSWPGNVRELKNAVWRAFILSDGPVEADITPDASVCPPAPSATADEAGSADAAARAPHVQVNVGMSLASAERQLIVATLRQCGGNKKRTAEVLGISLKTLYNRLTSYDQATD